ncbi:uncharacterized protein F5147DRAFT_670055 [Suillus discolor]|uniref:Uncharacterized protein n=1 Tax=Suillus discolor TaxID=1912936 RepID=A0A9P7FIZ9_9AGAM|nr:uncharacterized protein F5147DRAFT_670055 [Suillus discolor]KAG2118133.1 hypothetical protein F5147DRAFT_670055 [Suillus discolor]
MCMHSAYANMRSGSRVPELLLVFLPSSFLLTRSHIDSHRFGGNVGKYPYHSRFLCSSPEIHHSSEQDKHLSAAQIECHLRDICVFVGGVDDTRRHKSNPVW